MIPFHEWRKILWYLVSCFHPESWICLTGCTCKAYRNCFDTKNWKTDLLQKWYFHVFCGLCISAVPGNTLKQTLHMCQRHSFILCSQLKPWPERHAKIPSQKKIHLSILLTSEFSFEVSMFLHMNYEKKTSNIIKIHPSPRFCRIYVPLLHIFSANPFDLGLFRICHVNLEEGIFRPRFNFPSTGDLYYSPISPVLVFLGGLWHVFIQFKKSNIQ